MRLVHTAFYRFVALEDPDAVAAWLREIAAPLKGSVLVASEGINGVLAGEAASVRAFEQALTLDGRFSKLPFKRSECKTDPFARLRIRVRPEIVALGAPGVTGMTAASHPALPSEEWRRLLRSGEAVVLDNRNSFEFRLGRFKGAIDPGVERFSDFQRFVEEHRQQWLGKKVAMYCTGGIRCEKTGAWMESLGLDVVQLDGGILQYFQDIPDADQDWEGECFVFDNRIALDTQLKETSTTAEQVYSRPEDQWRLERALRLEAEIE